MAGPHSMIKTMTPRQVAPTRKGMPLSQSWIQVRNLVENMMMDESDDGCTVLNKYVSFLPLHAN